MKRRWIVGTGVLTDDQNKQFGNYLNGLGVGWWHWVGGLWLVVDNRGVAGVGVTELRDKLTEIDPGPNNIVLEVQGSVTWAGYGPSVMGNNMFTWLKDNWNSG